MYLTYFDTSGTMSVPYTKRRFRPARTSVSVHPNSLYTTVLLQIKTRLRLAEYPLPFFEHRIGDAERETDKDERTGNDVDDTRHIVHAENQLLN